MPNLTKPKDAEWLMAQDLQKASGIRCTATDEADRDGKPVAFIEQLGCRESGAVAWLHSLSIDVYAGTVPDYAAVWDAARSIADALNRIGGDVTGAYRDWHYLTVMNIYKNPSVTHADVPRVTIACTAILRGDQIS